MVSSGFTSLDEVIGQGGYPRGSAILAIGPPGIGKEALGYHFTYAGLHDSEFCVYASALSVKNVLHDMQGFGIDTTQKVPLWFTSSGGQLPYDVNDLSGISFNLKDALAKNSGRPTRIVIDSSSPFLMLSGPETVYKFLAQLVAEVRKYDAVLFTTVEEGMHTPQVVAALQQLFDGVLELRFFEDGLRLVPLLRVKKMRGLPPEAGYYKFTISRTGMEITAYVK